MDYNPRPPPQKKNNASLVLLKPTFPIVLYHDTVR